MSLYNGLALRKSIFRSLPTRILLRMWPLVFTLPLHLKPEQDPKQKLATLGLSCLGVSLGLLYYLMIQDLKPQPRSGKNGMGKIPGGPSLVRLARLHPSSQRPWPLFSARFGD